MASSEVSIKGNLANGKGESKTYGYNNNHNDARNAAEGQAQNAPSSSAARGNYVVVGLIFSYN